MPVNLSTKSKAQTLLSLKDSLSSALILPMIILTYEEWKEDASLFLSEKLKEKEINSPIIVRSSGLSEDTDHCSNAGAYCSVFDVMNMNELVDAIDQVFASYSDEGPQNEVLIQPQLQNVKASGVIFTKDPNTGGDYLIINYDEESQKTNTITSGLSNSLKCYIHHKHSPYPTDPFLKRCIDLATELEQSLEKENLDIEFALDEKNQLFLFQARPLIVGKKTTISSKNQYRALCRISQKIKFLSSEHPYLHGDKSIFGIMPDWNPAEIIGVRPKPLAFSLYRELVTDSVWAYQRNNYGYLNLRSFPLLVDFEGLPYVDIRISLNSFVPKNLDANLASKLVNYYLNRLTARPHLHDKIEFEVVFSCYSFNLRERLNELKNHSFTNFEQEAIFNSLNQMTQSIVLNESALWKKDLEKINTLKNRQQIIIENVSLDPLSKIYWLIEDCKRYGVLPFAGLARVGFIAVEILSSLVSKGIFTKNDYDQFFGSLKTISSEINYDFNSMQKETFLEKYGHLRPGTYDILSPSYDEAPDSYFNWKSKSNKGKDSSLSFELTLSQLRQIQDLLNQDNWEINVLEFLEFIKQAIESREYAKFIFTKSIHQTLKLIKSLSEDLGFSVTESAYIDIRDLIGLYSRSHDPYKSLKHSIELGQEQYEITKVLNLPPIIMDSQSPFSFFQTLVTPNFITQKKVKGAVVKENLNIDLQGKIVFIPNADPGFDWLFLKNIGGLITMYGGINSHMAIRANELGIPAVIGAGESHYTEWSQANLLHIDCQNRQVIKLQ